MWRRLWCEIVRSQCDRKNGVGRFDRKLHVFMRCMIREEGKAVCGQCQRRSYGIVTGSRTGGSS